MKKISLNFMNIFTFLIFNIFLLFFFRFSYICNVDLSMIFPQPEYAHFRYILTFFSALLIKYIPELLNIHTQDFSLISISFAIALSFNILIFTINIAFFKFYKNTKIFPFLYIITFLSLFIIPFIKSDNDNSVFFCTHMFFFPYIFSMIFFILLWNKISDSYLENKNTVNTKDLQILIILSILITQSNEFIIYITICSLAIFQILLFIESKSLDLKYYLLVPLIIISLSGLIIFSKSNDILYDLYFFSFTLPSKENVFQFFSLFVKNLFIKNLYLWIPIIISFLLLFKDNNKTTSKIIKINLILYTSFLSGFFATLFINPTNPYTQNEVKFWLLNPEFLIIFNIFLFTSFLYLVGYTLFRLTDRNKSKLTLILISLICILSFLINIYYNNKPIPFYYTKEYKTMMYIQDKISVFYFKQNKPAILPLPDIVAAILSVSSNNYSKIKFNTLITDGFSTPEHLQYLEDIYKINTKSGVIFLKDYQEAINIFIKNGGALNSKELKNLKFQNIKKELIKKI